MTTMASRPTGKGVARKGRPRRISDEDVAEMIRLRDNGLTHQRIAEQLNVSSSTVTRRLQGAGSSSLARKYPTARKMSGPEQQYILELLQDDWTLVAITEATGRSSGVIADIAREHGIDYARTPPRGGRPGKVAPRITPEGRPPQVTEQARRRVISGARLSGTLAGAARHAGVDVKTAERVLEHHAPLVLWAYVRRNVLHPGVMINNTAGELARTARNMRDAGLGQEGFDITVEDLGVDAVRRILDRLQADQDAARDLMRELRNALQRADGGQGHA